MKYLDNGDVDVGLLYIQGLCGRFRKESKVYSLDRLSGYIKKNHKGIRYREAREQGISICSGTVDKAGD